VRTHVPASEWHHTSKFFNATDFFDPEILKEFDWDQWKAVWDSLTKKGQAMHRPLRLAAAKAEREHRREMRPLLRANAREAFRQRMIRNRDCSRIVHRCCTRENWVKHLCEILHQPEFRWLTVGCSTEECIGWNFNLLPIGDEKAARKAVAVALRKFAAIRLTNRLTPPPIMRHDTRENFKKWLLANGSTHRTTNSGRDAFRVPAWLANNKNFQAGVTRLGWVHIEIARSL